MIGDIIYTQFPFSDRKGFKVRPGLVVSDADDRGDFYVLKISSSGQDRPSRISLNPEFFERGGLPKDSIVDVLDVSKTNKSMLVGYRGKLKADVINRILKMRILASTRTYSRLTHTANRPGNDPLRLATDPSTKNKEQRTNNQEQASPNQEPRAKNQEPSPPNQEHRPPPPIPYAGRVFTEDEVEAAVSSTLDFWLTLGKEGEAFEKELAAFLGVKHSLLVNSGSSANLIAISALTTHKLPEHKRIRPGDEVITVAAGFPTTVAPIVQVGAVPVFIDADPQTGNADCSQLEAAFSLGKTKAVMMAHALGNPFDLSAVLAFCKKFDLWLIEDNCDALGCTYSMPVERARELGLDHLLRLAEEQRTKNQEPRTNNQEPRTNNQEPRTNNEEPRTKNQEPVSPFPRIHDGILTAYTGSFGDISTQSFYPPHHLTMGEGGAVNIIRRASLKTYAESFRDWGRDCWCPSGKDNTCQKRFGWQLGELPEGYDHKYIYSHLGYNLKPLDPQAAIGRIQLKKLPAFIEARKRNWDTLRIALADLDHVFDFTLPTHATRWIPPSDRPAPAAQLLNDACSLPNPETNPQPATRNPDAFRFEECFDWDDSGCRTDASWFGFMLRIKPSAPFTHTDLARHLDDNKIGNRMLFGGNLLRQPAFVQLRRDRPEAFRVVGKTGEIAEMLKPETLKPETLHQTKEEQRTKNKELRTKNEELPPPHATPSPIPHLQTVQTSLLGSDAIMHRALFLGTYPGLTAEMLACEIQVIRDFVAGRDEI